MLIEKKIIFLFLIFFNLSFFRYKIFSTFYSYFNSFKIKFATIHLTYKPIVLTNNKAQKLILKIIENLNKNGINAEEVVTDLKELRPYAVNEKRPVVAKAIRLTYEHIDEFETFAIPIPEDDDIVDEETGEVIVAGEQAAGGPTESLIYLISLIKNEEHRRNKQEIREFNKALKQYADDFSEL